MATRNLCPRATGEGSVGTASLLWGAGYYSALHSNTLALAGTMTNSGQPAFLGIRNAAVTNVTGDGTFYTVPFNLEIFDRTSSFDPSSGVFTAPTTGVYQFNLGVTIVNLTSSHTWFLLVLATSNRSYTLADINPGTIASSVGSLHFSGSVLADMDTGDTASMTIYVSGSTKTIGLSSSTVTTFISGFLAA